MGSSPHLVVIIRNALNDARQHLDARAPVLELHNGHHMTRWPFRHICELRTIRFAHAMADGNVSSMLSVDFLHHALEYLPVG